MLPSQPWLLIPSIEISSRHISNHLNLLLLNISNDQMTKNLLRLNLCFSLVIFPFIKSSLPQTSIETLVTSQPLRCLYTWQEIILGPSRLCETPFPIYLSYGISCLLSLGCCVSCLCRILQSRCEHSLSMSHLLLHLHQDLLPHNAVLLQSCPGLSAHNRPLLL